MAAPMLLTQPLTLREIDNLRDEINEIDDLMRQYRKQCRTLPGKIAKLEKQISKAGPGINTKKLTEKLKEKRDALEANQNELEAAGKSKAEVQHKIEDNGRKQELYDQYKERVKARSAAKPAPQPAVSSGNHLFGGKKADPSNNRIRSNIRSVPLAKNAAAANRSMQSTTTSTKVRAETSAAKKTSSVDCSKTGSEEVAPATKKNEPSQPELVAPTAPMMAKAPPSFPASTPVEKATESSANDKKRKLTDLAEDDQQGPAKKARSTPEAASITPKATSGKKAGSKSPAAMRSSQAAKMKNNSSKLAVDSSSGQSGEAGKHQADSDDAEMSDIDDISASKNATASQTKKEKPVGSTNQPASNSSHLGKKRKAADDDDAHEAERPNKKFYYFTSDEDSPKKVQYTSSKRNGSTKGKQERLHGSKDRKPAADKTGENKDGESDPGQQKPKKVEVFIPNIENWKKGEWKERNVGSSGSIKGLPQFMDKADSNSATFYADASDDYKLRGLINPQNACFANAALQLLNTALTHDQIMALRGPAMPNGKLPRLSRFGFDYSDFMSDTEKNKRGKTMADLRSRISIAAATSGNVGVAPYLGQLLLDMRKGVSHKSSTKGDGFVTPVFFLQVFAYGCGKRKARLMFNGTTQQDSQEFLMKLMEALVEEGHTFIRDVFHVKKTSVTTCRKCAVEHNSDEDAPTISLGTASGDTKAVGDELKLQDLLDGKRSETAPANNADCEKCGGTNCRDTTISIDSLPNNLIVHLGRATGIQVAAKRTRSDKSKDATTVELKFEGTQYQSGDDHYELATVIRHQGIGSTSGHYDALIKHNDKWQRLNDDKREQLMTKGLKDNKDRPCVMLLLRKITQ